MAIESPTALGTRSTNGAWSLTVLSVLQDPRRKGGTATAVAFYRDWMDQHLPGDRQELFLDEQERGGLRSLRRWSADDPAIPRVLPMLQIPPYVAARRAVRRQDLDRGEIHVVGASAMHGWIVTGTGPTLVWLATTFEDERRPDILKGRSWSRRVAYAASQPVLGRLERRVLLDADRVLAMSSHTADVVVELGVSASRVEVVVVPVDTARFEVPADDSQRCGAVFVGRANDPRKGFDRLPSIISSSTRLRDRGVSVVSPGAPTDSTDGIRWLGRVDDLARVYQRAELLVMPSRQEGLGIVALEAMACGTPVVARECGGIDRILAESGGGLVTKTSEAFAKAVEDLLTDSDRARSMGESGRRWVEVNASRSSLLGDPKLFRL